MSKTILLELTEKEAEVLAAAIVKEKSSWEDKDPKEASPTLIENSLRVCNRLWAKLDDANRPQPHVLMEPKDLYRIIDLAKTDYCRLPLDLHISGKKIELGDYKHISLANAVILWLNGAGLLKKLPKFNVTDSSNQYEEME